MDDHFLIMSGNKNLIVAGMEIDWLEGRCIFHNKGVAASSTTRGSMHLPQQGQDLPDLGQRRGPADGRRCQGSVPQEAGQGN